MAHHGHREPGFRQQFLEPQDAREVEMISGLIEQQDIRVLNEGFAQGEPFSPSARQPRGFRMRLHEPGHSQHRRDTAFLLFVCRGGRIENVPHTHAGREYGILRDVGEARQFAQRHRPLIGLFEPRQNPQQRGLSAPVRADQSETVTFLHREIDFPE